MFIATACTQAQEGLPHAEAAAGPRLSSDVDERIDQDPELFSLATDVLIRASSLPASASASALFEAEAPLPSSLSSDVHRLVTCEDFKVTAPEAQLRRLMGLLMQVCGREVVDGSHIPVWRYSTRNADRRCPSPPFKVVTRLGYQAACLAPIA